MENTALAVAESREIDHRTGALALPMEMTPEVFEARIRREEEMRVMLTDYARRNMKEGHHFSNRLGTQELAKPMLLQDGMRNICSLFKLNFGNPEIDEKWLDGDHYRVRTHIVLYNAEGKQISSGDGICSTRETKYAYRVGQRVCPSCGMAAIYKDNKSPQGGWYCWAKKDGCGAKFAANEPAITDQQTGRIDNPDKADIENTVLKMSIKRAKSAAVCDVPMVSEIFAPEDDVKPVIREQSAARTTTKPVSQPAPVATAPDNTADKSTAVGAATTNTGSVKTAVDLSTKLMKEHGVEYEALAMQFLPEGVAKFSDLNEEQAADAIPVLAELLNSKVAARG